MANQKISLSENIRTYFIITVGLLIGALAWTGFIIPAGIVGSGVSGIATMIYFVTGIKVGYSVFLINTVFLLVSLRVLGFSFGIKTLYGITVISFFLWLFQSIITEPLVSDRFMCAIIGGIMAGAGAGMILSRGGSTGGTDILAMMINKYKNYSPGQLLLTIDVIIISSSYFLEQSIEQVVYGFVTMGVSAYCVDMIIEGSKQSVQIVIFTQKPELIRKEVIHGLDQGLTIINATGGYSKEDVKILMVLAKKRDSQSILKMIKLVDPDAFISLGSVMGVYGQGFDKIKS
ncbi:YitT family protein [Marinifilum caeruleilacunae]|uniref:YitT family protein n=1 Tax=Marinifilum caeruleilacunae TaxID=2499076 RepID=A0ABX1WZX6_9BACT|nr:YitT family protein [Marinifilum caeruleilacunae]NOU61657.1 YitT family protein [Marinifilum caeruleilacunae]